MASFTITTTLAQDKAIAWLVARLNEQHPDRLITAEQFVQQKASVALVEAEVKFKQEALELVPRRFRDAGPAVQAQILNLLGLAP